MENAGVFGLLIAGKLEYLRFRALEVPHTSSVIPSKSSHPPEPQCFHQETGHTVTRLAPNKPSVNSSSHEPFIMITALWAPEEMGTISCVSLCVKEAHVQDFFQCRACSDMVACLPWLPLAIRSSSGALGERDPLQTLSQHLAAFRPTARPSSCSFSSRASRGGRGRCRREHREAMREEERCLTSPSRQVARTGTDAGGPSRALAELTEEHKPRVEASGMRARRGPRSRWDSEASRVRTWGTPAGTAARDGAPRWGAPKRGRILKSSLTIYF